MVFNRIVGLPRKVLVSIQDDCNPFIILLPFWAAAPKGRCPVEHRGEFPYVRPSLHPPPVGHQGLKFALPALNLALQASNQPSRLQISPPRLKSDLQTSDLPSRPSTRPPSIKSALCGSNLPSKPQIHSQSLNSALQPSNMPSLA